MAPQDGRRTMSFTNLGQVSRKEGKKRKKVEGKKALRRDDIGSINPRVEDEKEKTTLEGKTGEMTCGKNEPWADQKKCITIGYYSRKHTSNFFRQGGKGKSTFPGSSAGSAKKKKKKKKTQNKNIRFISVKGTTPNRGIII